MARHRENFALRTSERWQPPAFAAPTSWSGRAIAFARRLLDLQAASAWMDLKQELGSASGDVLDVGAGAQPYRPLLPAVARYTAIDVTLADEGFGYQMPDTVYFDSDRWPIADGSTDLVLATETLEHVVDPAAFLAEAARVLRPGGEVLLTVPFSARWHYIPHDYWRYTPSSLRVLLEGAGFGRVVVHARGNATTVAVYKVMALILPALLPAEGGITGKRVVAVLALPLLGLLAVAGQLSLRQDGGDDCLGWTVRATRT